MKKKKATAISKEVNYLLKKGEPAPMTQPIEPMLDTLVSEPAGEKGWFYEMKWDGYRAVGYMDNGSVNLLSRNQKSFNEKYYPLYQSLKEWKINVVVDGEIVVVNEHGIPDFSNLQLWRSEADGELLYYLFDILWLDGVSLVNLPIEERKAILRAIVPTDHPFLRISESLKDSGKEAFK